MPYNENADRFDQHDEENARRSYHHSNYNPNKPAHIPSLFSLNVDPSSYNHPRDDFHPDDYQNQLKRPYPDSENSQDSLNHSNKARYFNRNANPEFNNEPYPPPNQPMPNTAPSSQTISLASLMSADIQPINLNANALQPADENEQNNRWRVNNNPNRQNIKKPKMKPKKPGGNKMFPNRSFNRNPRNEPNSPNQNEDLNNQAWVIILEYLILFNYLSHCVDFYKLDLFYKNFFLNFFKDFSKI